MCVAKWTESGEGHRGSARGALSVNLTCMLLSGMEGVRQMKVDISQGKNRHSPLEFKEGSAIST